jgi:hypothetical protein
MPNSSDIKPGIYKQTYFSSSEGAIYFGDIWCDEITNIAYTVTEPKYPIYGYADTLYRAVGKGQVLVQGQFSINFVEAGYLWLVLNEYQNRTTGKSKLNPLDTNTDKIVQQNIQAIVNNTTNTLTKNNALSSLAAYQTLTGVTGNTQQSDEVFNQFEDAIWGKETTEGFNNFISSDDAHRRATDPDLNGFDMYLTFGDYIGSTKEHFTLRKIENVQLQSFSQTEDIQDPSNLKETYSFIARNIK